ncbi:MAG: oligosaccharide flippase family protein [Candidatus Omnitrophica bacterium]|nr:oligosaccharide flippase family protein [Candidatus Omnitrophota bacterium]MCF7876712.1 oligosaccharide flippase family protein [Candidatus Omnitrophota bacterium]MCF7878962.1 oligosaccharide flippase family protein [Candidatus Omnitrophota bacterium]MCF7891445.1 oligosaccharide flippase family protein [Candidatus Omnitrophota bacterium]MCF7895381.1 oligosaccharide flippase family protein [Candidatus Omnitrophota bacterium]
MNLLKTITSNSGFVLAEKIVTALTSLCLTIILARYLGKANFGDYALILAIIHFFLMIANTWLEPVAVKELVKNNYSPVKEKIIGNIALFHILLALVFAIFISLNGSINPAYLVLIVTLLILNSLISSYKTVFKAFLRMKRYALSKTITNLVFLAAIILIIIIKGNIYSIFTAMIFIHILLLTVLVLSGNKIIKPVFKIDYRLSKKIFRHSAPLALTALFVAFMHRIDQLMLYQIKGSSYLGTYAASVKIAESFNIIALALSASLLPLLSKYHNRQPKRFKSIYRLSFKYLAILIIPLAFLINLSSREIIINIYGQEFSSAAPALNILIFAQIFYFFGMVNRQILVASNKQRLDPLFTGVSAGVNIGLNLLLIPRFSFTGAAAATLIAAAAGPILGYFILATKDYSQSMFNSSLKPAGISLIIYLFLSWLGLSAFTATISFLAIYIAALIAFKELSLKNIQLLKILLTKKTN